MGIEVVGWYRWVLPKRWRSVAVAATLLVLTGCGEHSNPEAGVEPSADNPQAVNGDPSGPGYPNPAVFLVNSEEDAVDARPGDGVCATSTGTCTLRAAVQEANAQSPINTVAQARVKSIMLPKGHYKFTLEPDNASGQLPGTSSSGVLSILGSMNIIGSGARETIIDGNQLDRVFYIWVGAVVTISDVTITGGDPGGIWSNGHLRVFRVNVTGNRASYGAGIFSTPVGYVEVDSSTISNNTADSEGGGIRIDASGLVINSTITGNTVLADCSSSCTDGGFSGEGGGIDARGAGAIAIVNSTITNNHAAIGGGGINIAYAYQAGTAPILDPTGTLLPWIRGARLTLVNSIVAGNTSDSGPLNCKHTIAPLDSGGGNIADDNSCELTNVGDLPNTDPRLLPLTNNGGPTETYALAPGSLAANNGIAGSCPAYDQRGEPRRGTTMCDSGAYQRSGN